MMRLSTVFWLLLVVATGFAVYAVKYEVQGLEDTLAQTRKATLAADRQIRVLTAEWAYLNRPDTLAEMNRRYLSLVPIATKQLHASATDIPLRAPVVQAVLDKPAASAEAAKPVAVKVAARAAAAAPKSLDDLIAKVVASR